MPTDLVAGERALPGLQVAVALSLCPHMGTQTQRAMPVSSLSDEAINPIGLGPHPMTSFNLNHLLKLLSPNIPSEGWGFNT